MLFCGHASVSESHIDISKNTCPAQPFHWYYLGEEEVARDDGEKLVIRLLTICDDCEKRSRMDKISAIEFAMQDAPWIGTPPVITRMI